MGLRWILGLCIGFTGTEQVVVQVAVMNAALRSALGTVGVAAPGQLAATKSECKSSTAPAALRAATFTKRPLSFPSMSASFPPGQAMAEGASQMRNAVANHVVSLA